MPKSRSIGCMKSENQPGDLRGCWVLVLFASPVGGAVRRGAPQETPLTEDRKFRAALFLSVLSLLVTSALIAPASRATEPFEVIATISVSHTSQVTASGQYAFVASNSDISVIDTSSNTVVRTVATGGITSPRGAATVGDKVYFAAADSDQLVTLDTQTWTVTRTSTNVAGNVCDKPVNLFVVSQTRLVVDCETSNSIQIYDITGAPTRTATVSVGGSPRLMSANGNTIFVPNITANNISIIDTSAGTPTATNVAVGARPNATAYLDGKIYVVNFDGNSVSIVDATSPYTVLATVAVGNNPQEIEPCGGNIYTANRWTGNTSVISPATNAVTKTITLADVGAITHVMAVKNDYAYFLNADRASLSVVDCAAEERVALVTITTGPSSIAFSDSAAYISNASNTISVMSIPVTQASGTSGSASEAPTETLTLQETPGVSCASGAAAGRKGQWVSVPASSQCLVSGDSGGQVLGWATIADFPIDIAQRQVTNGWGAYELFDAEGRMTGVFIPAGGSTLLSGSTQLYPIIG